MRHVSTPFTLSELAEYVKVSPEYLSSSFHTWTGKTITEYTRDQRIEAAKILLKEKNYTLAEISSLFCFNSQSYFTKVFARKVGVTPRKYQETEL